MSVTDELLANNAEYALACPFVPVKDSVRGFVFDVATGRLAEVH